MERIEKTGAKDPLNEPKKERNNGEKKQIQQHRNDGQKNDKN